ncbi:hypothetical protein BTVI_45741 [Pitangus sulphuratus]|nr:hypothetical protein BTVI_45741 [Pitangus sulphuratus]
MKFNKAECKVLHLGQGNSKHKCKLGGEHERCKNSPEEKDLGMLVDQKLNMTWQRTLTEASDKRAGKETTNRFQKTEKRNEQQEQEEKKPKGYKEVSAYGSNRLLVQNMDKPGIVQLQFLAGSCVNSAN